MKKKTSSKKTSFAYEIWDAIKSGVMKAFLAIWVFIKTFVKGLFLFLEKLFQFIVALLLAIAKILRAFAFIILTFFISLVLAALSFFLVARGVDLRNSESFRELRDRTFEVCNEWLEPDFVASEMRAAAWLEYRAELRKIHVSNIPNFEKEEMVEKARAERDKKLLSAGTVWIFR